MLGGEGGAEEGVRGRAAEVVHGACRVDFGLEVAGRVGELSAGQDVEVVIGGVAAGVAFGANGGAEDD